MVKSYNSFLFEYILKQLEQLLQSHDPSEIILICWFAVQETFLVLWEIAVFDEYKVKKNEIHLK